MTVAGSRVAIEASELPVLLRSDKGDGRLISQFVKTWAVSSRDEREALISCPVSSGTAREQAVAAAIVHGMCVHYQHAPPPWVHGHCSPEPVHPITDRRLLNARMRARIIMTASPVCRRHNVWFSESLVSASRSIPPPPLPPLLRDRTHRLVAVGADERLLSGDEVIALFGELDARLVEAGGDTSIDISIGGGAAMALLMDNRATVDVDVLNREMPEALASAAADMADTKGLPADWMNSSASAYADMGDPGFSAEPVFRGSLLTVRRPDLKHLLAMKLVAARDKDLPDAAWLAQQLGITGSNHLFQVVTDTYEASPGMDESVEWSRGFIEHVLDEVEMQKSLAERLAPEGDAEVHGSATKRPGFLRRLLGTRSGDGREKTPPRTPDGAEPTKSDDLSASATSTRGPCGAEMPRAKSKCILPAGHKGGHRSKK